MTGPELHKLLQPCFGPKPGLAVREACVVLLKGATRVCLRYDWIKEWQAIEQLVERDDVELSDGQEWITLWVGAIC